ncbi:MAG: L-aspartate oxidase [Clostridia bacterium]|nr:L-aspartate oxidase [Clostridia bacterium]
MKTDILIVGCGVGGLFTALNLPRDKNITIITKDTAEKSDSFLAQGGICVLHDAEDYDAFYEDTMRAGHYENNPESVKIMIESSREVIDKLVSFGVDFEKNGGDFAYTREGAHSRPRILYHKDQTGKEITSCLLEEVRKRENITFIENYTMVDLICKNNICYGIIGKDNSGEYSAINADYTVLASGGIGGLFAHSTNYKHLTGDALALALKYDIKLKNIDYIQIHPTTLYSQKSGRDFLISESVRGEGALLYNSKGERFTDELLPRDVVANAIFEEMKKEGSEYVYLSLENIAPDAIKARFPHIYKRCLEEGYDITKEPIPVVPAQHYFMGGIDVDAHSKTSMDRLYAVGETSCNGVHGKNRLASNSLLESLVFASRAAKHLMSEYKNADYIEPVIDPEKYENCENEYKEAVLSAIEREKQKNG